MTIDEFTKLAKECKTKAELISMAKSNGVVFTKEDLNKLFHKIQDGTEIIDSTLEITSGGNENVYGKDINDIIQ